MVRGSTFHARRISDEINSSTAESIAYSWRRGEQGKKQMYSAETQETDCAQSTRRNSATMDYQLQQLKNLEEEFVLSSQSSLGSSEETVKKSHTSLQISI